MKLSFIIPAYNEENYIGDCLSSIFLLEDLPDYEVIVTDNDSTDGTARMVQKNFSKVTIVHEKQRGPSRAKNAGAKSARGEFLAFVDADCRPPKDWWKIVSQEFAHDPDLVMLDGPYRYYEVENWFWRTVYYLANVVFIVIANLIFQTIYRKSAAALTRKSLSTERTMTLPAGCFKSGR